MAKIKVFLMSEFYQSSWPDKLIPMLKVEYERVADLQVEKMINVCDYALYVITPKINDLQLLIHAVYDSIMFPARVILCYLTEDDGEVWSDKELTALRRLTEVVTKHGALVFSSLKDVADFLNKNSTKEETVRSIVKDYLVKNNLKGLANKQVGCRCHVENLMPCAYLSPTCKPRG